jgi:hypothetical protein
MTSLKTTRDEARGGTGLWEDSVGDMLSYICEPRPWVKQIVAIAHNAKAFDLQFNLDRAVFLKWRPELIMNGQKIMCMTVEHIKFIDSISYLPCVNSRALSVCQSPNRAIRIILTLRIT